MDEKEGWIKWEGESMPVSPDVQVQVLFGSGRITLGYAGTFYWGRTMVKQEQICNYRVQDTPQPATSRPLVPSEQDELLHEMIAKVIRLESELREMKIAMTGVMVENIRLRRER